MLYLTASNISSLTTLWYNRWLHSGFFVLKILWIYFTLLKLIISWISALGIPQPFTNIRGHYWWMCQNRYAMHTFPNFFIQSSLMYVRVCGLMCICLSKCIQSSQLYWLMLRMMSKSHVELYDLFCFRKFGY